MAVLAREGARPGDGDLRVFLHATDGLLASSWPEPRQLLFHWGACLKKRTLQLLLLLRPTSEVMFLGAIEGRQLQWAESSPSANHPTAAVPHPMDYPESCTWHRRLYCHCYHSRQWEYDAGRVMLGGAYACKAHAHPPAALFHITPKHLTLDQHKSTPGKTSHPPSTEQPLSRPYPQCPVLLLLCT